MSRVFPTLSWIASVSKEKYVNYRGFYVGSLWLEEHVLHYNQFPFESDFRHKIFLCSMCLMQPMVTVLINWLKMVLMRTALLWLRLIRVGCTCTSGLSQLLSRCHTCCWLAVLSHCKSFKQLSVPRQFCCDLSTVFADITAVRLSSISCLSAVDEGFLSPYALQFLRGVDGVATRPIVARTARFLAALSYVPS